MDPTSQPVQFPKDQIGIFIGHADDADAESKAIYGLQAQCQRELEGFRKINPSIPYSTVKFWEWTEDASCEVGGQACVIDPAITHSLIAVFVFRDRIGKVTWEELEKFRKLPKPRRLIALFPKNPSDLSKLGDKNYMQNWSDLLAKREILTTDWTEKESSAVRPFAVYENTGHLTDLAFKGIKSALTDIASGGYGVPDTMETLDITPYLAWIEERCGQMDLRKLANQPVTVDLPELYIPLLADDPERPAKERTLLAGQRAAIEATSAPVDLEELVARHEYLLIEGEPGSGKTTLLKRIALNMAGNHGEKTFSLPILVFLRELGEILSGVDYKSMNAEKLLELYFSHHAQMLSCAAIKRFCEEKKALFLIDGLDEIPFDLRNRVVEEFADLRTRHGARMVLSGRPHGIEGVAMERFGKKHVKVLPFTPAQRERFITKWCEVMYVKSPAEGAKMAVEMKAEIQGHEAIGALAENPLMLTTVCILYYEGERLPDQRAELYRKFVDNLAHRRFEEPDKILDVLKGLGFTMQKGGEKGIDRCEALNVVKSVFSRQKEEPEKAYSSRIEALFDELEPKCGLLRLEGGQYRFWHLTFQEYLAAEYLVSSSDDLVKAIEPYVADERNREMVKLYIGCLSINQKKIAATIIRNMISEKSGKESRLLLAGESLTDIKKERRDEGIVNTARQVFSRIVDTARSRKAKADFGEIVGRLGDDRDFKEFVKIKGGWYKLEGLGEKEVKPFEIGMYPVTNAWYREFIDDKGYENDGYWTAEGRKWKSYVKAVAPDFWGQKKWSCPNSPVIGVCWWEADAFCRWLTKTQGDGVYRLPAEEEWQAAAAGFEGREYAWGDEFDAEKCNCREGEGQVEKTSPVGIFKGGNTPEGIADMSGNVWEWCRSGYMEKQEMDDFPFDREVQDLWNMGEYVDSFKLYDKKGLPLPVLRGGSFDDAQSIMRCAYRIRGYPNYWDLNAGFRCVR